jgi:hypothetical protein
MLDITSESTLTLTAACRLLPPGRNGARPQLSTLLRWILRGCRTADGQFVRLEACRLGSKWITSREALQRFVERLTPPLDRAPGPVPRSPAQRQRASERAGKQLDAAGV